MIVGGALLILLLRAMMVSEGWTMLVKEVDIELWSTLAIVRDALQFLHLHATTAPEVSMIED